MEQPKGIIKLKILSRSYPKRTFLRFDPSQCHLAEPSYCAKSNGSLIEIICLHENLFPGVQTFLKIYFLRTEM